MKNNLKSYHKKRNFQKTKEPYGKIEKRHKKLKFVVQHHYAWKEHYDLRLEYKGVYKSFAVPKGPSYNPKDKRLSVMVEDHPLSYGNFEGVIPQGEYGGGIVILWDQGEVEFQKGFANFDKGIVKFYLKGQRLHGSWTLVHFKNSNWLLIKEKDEFVKKWDITKFTRSIKSGKTREEIAKKDDLVNLTSPEKIIIPSKKVTKKDIFNYYNQVKMRMMPFLQERLISTIRCPKGINEEKFFMKHLNTKSKNIGKKKVKGLDYYYIKNVTGILEEVQMNSYEFHIWASKKNKITKPDLLIFDLDPDQDLSLETLKKGVKKLKKVLDNLSLKSYLKTSGGKGYHIYVPLVCKNYDESEQIAFNIATILVENDPSLFTLNMRKEKRKGKIFIDYFRNKLESTSVCPYSLRLRSSASISFPIKWSDLEKIGPSDITIHNYQKYLKRKDAWSDFFLD